MTADEHLERARHNEAFVQHLLEAAPEFFDWILTGSLYAAVHYVEAALEAHSHHSFNHADRKKAIQKNMVACYRAYRALEDLSMTARYSSSVTAQQDYHQTVGRHLDTVKRVALAKIRRAQERSQNN